MIEQRFSVICFLYGVYVWVLFEWAHVPELCDDRWNYCVVFFKKLYYSVSTDTEKIFINADINKHLWHMQVYDSLNIQIYKLYLLFLSCQFLLLFSGTFTIHTVPLHSTFTLKISWMNEDYKWEK